MDIETVAWRQRIADARKASETAFEGGPEMAVTINSTVCPFCGNTVYELPNTMVDPVRYHLEHCPQAPERKDVMTGLPPKTKAIPVREYEWTDDYSYMRELTCKNHPTARYLTKNPWSRSLHFIKPPDGYIGECECPFSDLVVIVKGE